MLADKSEPVQRRRSAFCYLKGEDEQERDRALRRNLFLHDQVELRGEGIDVRREEERTESIRRMSRLGMPVLRIAAYLSCPEEEIQKVLR